MVGFQQRGDSINYTAQCRDEKIWKHPLTSSTHLSFGIAQQPFALGV